MTGWLAAGLFREVTTAAAVTTLLNAGATSIDLRDATAFDAGHMQGALNVPAADVPMMPAAIMALDTDTTLVLYGAGGVTFDELVAAMALEGMGFTRVVYYSAGWANYSPTSE